MNQKNTMEVLIDGKIYQLSGSEEEMYLQKMAAYLNEKIWKLRKDDGFSRLSADYQSVLVQLNIADDFYKEQERANTLAEQNSVLEKDIYSLKHELITTQMQLERVERELEMEKGRHDGEKRPQGMAKAGMEAEKKTAIQAAAAAAKM